MNKLKEAKKLDRKRLKEWSIEVRNRDGKCVICGCRTGDFYFNKKGKKLKKVIHAHHLIPKENHKYRYDIKNGIALCQNHHKYSLRISPHKNPFVFHNFLMTYRKEQYDYLHSQTFVTLNKDNTVNCGWEVDGKYN